MFQPFKPLIVYYLPYFSKLFSVITGSHDKQLDTSSDYDYDDTYLGISYTLFYTIRKKKVIRLITPLCQFKDMCIA